MIGVIACPVRAGAGSATWRRIAISTQIAISATVAKPATGPTIWPAGNVTPAQSWLAV
jgi:hypothetical protein